MQIQLKVYRSYNSYIDLVTGFDAQLYPHEVKLHDNWNVKWLVMRNKINLWPLTDCMT